MQNNLTELSRVIRHHILSSTTEAGSGHPTSSMSAVELLATLMFGGYFRQDLKNPRGYHNDRLVFSKGHASPLLYSLYAACGGLSHKELMSLRKFGSNIEGHPTPAFAFADVASGSLGQGLSVGLGMALGIKLRIKNYGLKLAREPKVFVLLGDSEVAEGQIYEAAQTASFYSVNNLVAILDVNRLGQRGPTMIEWNLKTYQKRFESFGWNVIVIEDGHDLAQVQKAYEGALGGQKQPTIFIAKTIKGKGVSFLENKDNWHGKTVPKDQLEAALHQIGVVDLKLTGTVAAPAEVAYGASRPVAAPGGSPPTFTSPYSTREAYGDGLVELGKSDFDIVAIDGETGNSTYLEKFQKVFPDRYFEMYIAEQNMVSVATGFQKLGFKPYVATFSAFLTRAFDQIRMAQYSDADLNICGSHAGVSIGQDGSSQMGLEDIAMMRSLLTSTVLYPSDPYQTADLMKQAHDLKGITYIRTTREKTTTLYSEKDTFKVGGSRVVKESDNDVAVIFAAGITLHEALKAYDMLQKDAISVSIVDLYSVKPIDEKTIVQFVISAKNVIVIEDHYPYGGIGEAVMNVIVKHKLSPASFTQLAVRKIPHSGSPQELLHFEEIDSNEIVNAVCQNRQ